MLSEEKILGAKILAVDDDVLSLQILKKILSSAGFMNVSIITDAAEAEDFYQETNPDLLLLDLYMPVVSGFEVMARLTKRNPNDYLPILVLSAADEKERLKALSCGAKDFLHKPYQASEVILRSRNIIEVRLLYQQMKNQNLSLEVQVEERTKELKQTRLDVIHRLASAAELRDTDTGEHIIRMSRYCEQLALQLGLSASQAEMILNTSPLHDIGKIAIPDSILLKPGKLDPVEYDIMKTHTTIGAKILSGSNSPFLKMAEMIALTHHERFDGKGYPRRLKGEDIPLAGRICAVADVFDALTSRRPYKQPWTFKEAVIEIQKGKSESFDPQVVDAFCDIEKKIFDIYHQYY
ncbi:MAG: response regulator [Candidatus Omnitrophica bacterium]|nr:response regulator [Candidatus Omnitrophota bacterium]